jgi:Spy/CpxP family protein refolding chaperone
MGTFWKWSLLALAVPAGYVAAAQPADDAIPSGTTARLLLLRQRSVQQELKLTPDVIQKIMAFTNKESGAYGKALKQSGEERQKAIEGLEREEKKFLEDNLTAAQRKRLDQITLQVTGLQQLTRPEAARALNLTEEQQQKFKEMAKEARKALRAIIDSPNREGRNEKLAKLREAIDKKIEALLTDDQKAKARELIGEPFKGEIVFEEAEPEK